MTNLRPLLSLVLLLTLLSTACSDDSEPSNAQPSTTPQTSSTTTPDASLDTGDLDTGDEDATDQDTTPDTPEPTPEQRAARERFQSPGPFPAGNITVTLTDNQRDRTLSVEIWYPATDAFSDAAGQGAPLADFGTTDYERQVLTDLLERAPEGCPTAQTQSARDATIATGPFPLVLFSHCLQCTRFSSFSVAQHLASHGFIVAAPGHQDDTLFDKVGGSAPMLTDDFLQTRSLDVRFVLDSLLNPQTDLPQPITAAINPDQIGMMGHSFGAVTTGLTVQNDPRLKAALALAAPIENPIFPSVSLASIQTPLLLLVAVEDNSITEFGNQVMRFNFNDATPPVWKLEATDAGHWSFSDICALHEDFNPGCGEDQRQTDPNQTFSYIPVPEGLSIARTTAAAFFSAHLRNDPQGTDALHPNLSTETLNVQQRLSEDE